MHPIRSAADRRGFQFLVLVLFVAILIVASAVVAAQRSRAPVEWAVRFAGELAVRDVVLSALEEATREVMLAAGDPQAELFARLRAESWSSIELEPRVERARALLRGAPSASGLVARARFSDRRALVPGSEEESEWAARLVVTVQVALSGAAGGRVVGTQEREVRATSASPPRPLDAFGFLVAGRPGSTWRPALDTGAAVPDVHLDPAVWRRKATLEVGGDDPTAVFEGLARRLGAVNGVMLVENEGGRTLSLARRRHRGKLVLVVLGPLELSDVEPEDPALDLLTVIAFGDVRLAGTVHAALVLTGRQGASPARELAPGSHLTGSLVVTCGELPPASGARLTFDTRASFAGPLDRAIDPAHIVVSISPTLVASTVEVRS